MNRSVLDLGGAWQCLPDAGAEGEAAGYPHAAPYDASWTLTVVPSAFEQNLPAAAHHTGAVWYRRL